MVGFPAAFHKFHLVDFYGNYDVRMWTSLVVQWFQQNVSTAAEELRLEEADINLLAETLASVHFATQHFVFGCYGDRVQHFVSPLKLFECLSVFSGVFGFLGSKLKVSKFKLSSN